MADDPSSDIRVTPGGMVSTAPPHLVGLRGSTPYLDNVLTIDGFQNLVSLNGLTAVPFANTASDAIGLSGSLLLGGPTVGAGDCVDVARQNILGQVFSANRDTSFVPSAAGFNNEFIQQPTALLVYGAYQEAFTVGGTVTATAASNIIVGAGTAFTTCVLAGAYLGAGEKSLDKVIPGDLIGINNAGGTAKNWFRVIAITDATHLVVYPTPQAGNASLGAGRAYSIIRTGYGGYSRGIPFDVNGTIYFVYCGSSHNLEGSGQNNHGVLQAISFLTGANHFMAPKTTDALGAVTAFFPRADDLIYYKQYLLYGAEGAVSWSKPGFPHGAPFALDSFPAENISAIDASGKFVSFEILGDQVVALFEEAAWLVSHTGTVPEFTFYRLPEVIGVQHPAASEPCGVSVNANAVYGRPSCTGRGAVFYVSNRGIEQLSGGLSSEASEPIYDVIRSALGVTDVSTTFLSWSDDFDLVWIRPAWGETGKALIYNPKLKDWSTAIVMPPQGRSVVALTAGVPAFSRRNDIMRRWHVGYYETLANAGVPAANGGNHRVVTNTPDSNGNYPGLSGWKWRSSVVPLGLRYPDFSFGGVLFDIYSRRSSPITVTWRLLGGSSPYNLALRDSGTLTMVATGTLFVSGWGNSNDSRYGIKLDDAFVCVELAGTEWVQVSGALFFNSNTAVKR